MHVSIGSGQTASTLTPVANTQRLLLARVEHRADDHEARGDRAFAHAQDEPDSEETAKVLARRVRAERHAPNEDVQASPRQG